MQSTRARGSSSACCSPVFHAWCSKPPITRKWLMPITVRPLPSTMQKARRLSGKRILSQPKPPTPPWARSLHQGPPPRLCPKQESVCSAGDLGVVGSGMSNTSKLGCLTQPIKTFRSLCQDSSWDSPDAFAFYCISWQQPAREVLCNKYINIIQTTLSLICPPQKRTCLSFPHAAAIREAISKVEAIAVQEQSLWNTN